MLDVCIEIINFIIYLVLKGIYYYYYLNNLSINFSYILSLYEYYVECLY